MKDKKTIIIVILLCVIACLVGFILGKDKLFNKEEPTPEPVVEVTNEEALATAIGEWGRCTEKYSCYGVFISQNEENEFTFSEYLMWSEWGPVGKIQKIEKLADNKFELTVHYDKVENEEFSYEESTETHTIDLSELTNNAIEVDDQKYEKITGDREEFFNNLTEKY